MEAESALNLAKGSFWGGRRTQANLATFRSGMDTRDKGSEMKPGKNKMGEAVVGPSMKSNVSDGV